MKDDDMLLFGDIVNKHHDEIVRRSMGKSLEQDEVEYTETKDVPVKKLRNPLIIILLLLTLVFGGIKVTEALETAPVNGRINYYQSMMDSTGRTGENDHSIENFVKYNYLHGNDPVVSYEYWNKNNFVNHILEASRAENPAVEVRCALIAAYHVINAPYRKEQFEVLFDKIKDNEEFINNTGFDVSKGSIWQMLGYKDFDDFQKNIKNDTKKLYLAEKGGKNGKGM